MLEKLASNQALASEFAKRTFPELPVDVWLRHINVSGSMRTYFRYHFHPIDTTQKVLKSGIRHIQIAKIASIHEKDEIFSRMSAQSFKLVWSENEPDVDKNLQQSIEEQLAATLGEMKNFAVQVERYQSYYYVLTNVLKWVIEVIQSHKRVPDDRQLAERARVVGAERGILGPYLKWILNQIVRTGYVEEPDLKELVTNLDIDGSVDQIKDSLKDIFGLGARCESMRKEIDEFRSRCAVTECLLRQIVHPSEDYYVPAIEERLSYAAFRALSWVPMYRAKDDVKRRVLTDLDLDEISRSIVLVEQLGTKSEYRLARSEEEIQELMKLSNIGRTEKEHAKYIRPVLRKVFPKSVDTYVTFSTITKEDDIVIPTQVRLHAMLRGKEINAFRELLKKLGFSVDRSYDDSYYATLSIDISQLDGDRERIKKLIRSKLDFLLSDPYRPRIRIK